MKPERRGELTELKIEIVSGEAETVDNTLLESENDRWSLLEDAIAHRAWIVGIFESEPEGRVAWTELAEQLGSIPIGPLSVRKLAEEEWRDSYKAHFHPWRFGHLHWVPVWDRASYQLPAGDAVLWLDPGLAFGTGNHETTRLCVERLVQHSATKSDAARVVDAGCGSGILALSAAKLGYRNVYGFDNDPEAIRVSEENALLNDLAQRVSFREGDLVTGLAAIQADVLMANILANVLIQFASQITNAVAPGGWLILSGILSEECEQVRSVFGEVVPHWSQESRVLGEWSDVLFIRPRHQIA